MFLKLSQLLTSFKLQMQTANWTFPHSAGRRWIPAHHLPRRCPDEWHDNGPTRGAAVGVNRSRRDAEPGNLSRAPGWGYRREHSPDCVLRDTDSSHKSSVGVSIKSEQSKCVKRRNSSLEGTLVTVRENNLFVPGRCDGVMVETETFRLVNTAKVTKICH